MLHVVVKSTTSETTSRTANLKTRESRQQAQINFKLEDEAVPEHRLFIFHSIPNTITEFKKKPRYDTRRNIQDTHFSVVAIERLQKNL